MEIIYPQKIKLIETINTAMIAPNSEVATPATTKFVNVAPQIKKVRKRKNINPPLEPTAFVALAFLNSPIG
jgi:hypothetical protein